MPPASPSIWIIVPTYNERENVGPIVDAILGAVPDAHVLIVDDGSPDGTGELADVMAKGNNAIAVMHRSAKQGLGRAYVAAFKDLLARDGKCISVRDDQGWFSREESPEHVRRVLAH